MSTTLDLFATAGFDRLSLLYRELSTRIDETNAEAVFVESSESPFDLVTWARGFLASPATATGFGLYTLVGYFLYALGTRSIRSPRECAARRLEADGSIPVYRVGESSPSVVSAGGVVSTLVEWGAVVAIVSVFSATGVATTVAAAFFVPIVIRYTARVTRVFAALLAVLLAPTVSLLLVIETGATAVLAVSVLAFLVTSSRQTDDRAETTLEHTERLSTTHDYDRAVLLATQTTVSSWRERAPDSIASVWVRRAFRTGHQSGDD